MPVMGPVAGGVAWGVGATLVAAGAVNPDPASGGDLLNYGVLGILAVVLIAFARTAYKRETDRADAAEEKNDHRQDVWEQKVIPALESQIASNREQTAAMLDFNRIMTEMRMLERIQYEQDPPPAPRRRRPPAKKTTRKR